MNYIPEHQYRCTIIRGKSQSEVEDLLPFYAQTVHKNCPCTKEEFDFRCNRQLAKYFFSNEDYEGLTDANKKTIRNHITEIMGKLLGLYYITNDGMINETESCEFLLSKNDFPAFFKNICLNFQFPNFADKIQTLQDRLANNISIKPMCYVIAFLDYARKQTINKAITKQEIGYYILNNLDVLQGKVPVETVYSKIMDDRKNKVKRDKLTGSYEWQHIKEQFNLLELSNVVETDAEYIWLNHTEENAIQIFLKKNQEPLFDFYKFNFNSEEDKISAKIAWTKYFGKMNPELQVVDTQFTETSQTAELKKEKGSVGLSTVELGDKGEAFVYRMECERVKAFKERLVNKVLLLGKTKGLGYDISSIEADENPAKPEFARYIEVKSTTRISEPSFDENWSDTLNLTSKEWVAAEQYGEYYNIYRVYFTKKKTIVIKINNPFKKAADNEIDVFPTIYQMEFNAKVIKKQYEETV
jgi:hypothetical protein